MKKFFLLALTLCLISNIASANNKEFERFYNRFASIEGCTSVKMGNGALKLLAGNDAKFQGLEGIEKLYLLTVDNKVVPTFDDEVKMLLDNKLKYEPLLTIQEDGDLIQAYLNKEDKGLSAFLLVKSSDGETVVIYIYGKFDLKDVSSLSKVVL